MFEGLQGLSTSVGTTINSTWFADEAQLVRSLAQRAEIDEISRCSIEALALELIEAMRRDRLNKSGLDAFMQQYDLSSQEGVVLMCLAETLLRIPDTESIDAMIADRLAAADWEQYLGASDSLFVNASTWGLMLTGRLVDIEPQTTQDSAGFLHKLMARIGEPIVRQAMLQAMQIMAQQFVMGRDIDAALQRSTGETYRRYRYSFDMLGEAALTMDDAGRYSEAYGHSIETIGATDVMQTGALARNGISIKLSALSPRFEFAQHKRALREIVPRLTELAATACRCGVPITIDVEESDRLELTLAIFEAVYTSSVLGNWEGFGLAVQAYQRRAPAVIEWLSDLSARNGRRIPVRLVKGAYWDTEIKRAQEAGHQGYPVFTRKAHTDVAYLACARMMLDTGGRLVPQFATHNAHTVAYVLHHVRPDMEFEFQRLHGMGLELYDQLLADDRYDIRCRVYAPVGEHEYLLPYLVRRLLENGANTSFVNRIVDENIPAATLAADPVGLARNSQFVAHPDIPPPEDLFGAVRRNSTGLNLADGAELEKLAIEMKHCLAQSWTVHPVVAGKPVHGKSHPVTIPYDTRRRLGCVEYAGTDEVDRAIQCASMGFSLWNSTPVAQRSLLLERAADLIEVQRASLVALCIAEAGKCLPDALADIREAVDFLRYYASEGRRLMADSVELSGPTGERNELRLAGRGVFVCISPWNFPSAIFIGQIAAALVTGNSVIAKPAEQTSILASRLFEILITAGIPSDVLQFVPGSGSVTGAHAVADERIAGVVFTGSNKTAQLINRSLAAREGPIATLIAETGGLNAMIVDSTALVERVIMDAVRSAFNSAGQRCSALRLLCLQDDIADRSIELLRGRMMEISIGRPDSLATDVGPVINSQARLELLRYRDEIVRAGSVIWECEISDELNEGSFFAPLAVEIPDIDLLTHEVFGPILHVLRYRSDQLDDLIAAINVKGYGLTFGFHSRIESRIQRCAGAVMAGNIYVNRDMIGAVVGAQPFGGQGLSGTGPKAGGPHYLLRFVTEKTVSINTAAIGGDARLLGLESSGQG